MVFSLLSFRPRPLARPACASPPHRGPSLLCGEPGSVVRRGEGTLHCHCGSRIGGGSDTQERAWKAGRRESALQRWWQFQQDPARRPTRGHCTSGGPTAPKPGNTRAPVNPPERCCSRKEKRGESRVLCSSVLALLIFRVLRRNQAPPSRCRPALPFPVEAPPSRFLP